MINQSVGDSQVVNSHSPEPDENAVTTHPRAKRHHSAASPDHTVPIAHDGPVSRAVLVQDGSLAQQVASGKRGARASEGGRTARGRSSRRRGRADRGGESHARDSSIGDTIDEARTTNEHGESLIVRLQMGREKLRQVTSKTAQSPAEVRPLATET